MTIELLRLGDDTFRARRYAEALEIYARAAEAAEVMGQPAARIEALAQVAHAHLALGQVERGRPWLTRAGELARPSEPLAWSRYLLVRGRFERRAGRHGEALATFDQLYREGLEQGLHERAVEAAQLAGVVAPHEQLVDWARRAIAAAEAGALDRQLGPLWHDLGSVLEVMGEGPASLAAFRVARDRAYRAGDERARLVADWSVGRAYRRLGQLAEARAWLRETLLWAERWQEVEPTPPTDEWLARCHWELAEVDLAEGARDAALAHLETARPLLARAGLPRRWPEGMRRFEQRLIELRGRPQGLSLPLASGPEA